jgi:hypothetical protein
MNTQKDGLFNILLVIELTIMGIFCLINIFEKILFISNINEFWFYFGFFQYLIVFYHYIFTIICIIKIFIVLIIIKQKGLKINILHLNNIFQLIMTVVHLLLFIYLVINKYNKYFLIYIGIPLLINAFCILIFQIYFINEYKSKIIRLFYSIIFPIVSLLLNFEMWRLNVLM